MSTLPRVSIITPSYHQAAFLEQTLRSVLEQDYPHIEYIVVDGASTDGSVDIIRRYADRLSWWVSEPDKGQADAICKGMERATGEIVAWLNSDDVYLPDTLSRVVEVFQKAPEVGLVFGDVLSMDENGTVFNRMRYGNWGLEDLMCFSIIGQAGTFMRRTVLEQAGFLDTRFHYLLDHHLWLRMAQLAPLRYLPETLAAARFHPDAKNVALAARFGDDAMVLLDWMQAHPVLAPKVKHLGGRVQAGAYRFKARYLLDGGQPWQALQFYLKSIRWHPATALVEWQRMVYAGLCLLGMERLKPLYLRLRHALQKRNRDYNDSVKRLK